MTGSSRLRFRSTLIRRLLRPWKKIDTFEALAVRVSALALAGRRFSLVISTSPWTFSAPARSSPSAAAEAWSRDQVDGERYHRKSGDTHPRVRWRDGVLSVPGDERSARTSSRVSRPPRVQDRRDTRHSGEGAIFRPHPRLEDFTIVDAGYYNELAHAGLSATMPAPGRG